MTRAGSPVAAEAVSPVFGVIEHLDFELPCTTNWCRDEPNPADYVIEGLDHLPHISKAARAGELRTCCDTCWQRITSQQVGRCGCGEVTYWYQLWRINEVLR